MRVENQNEIIVDHLIAVPVGFRNIGTVQIDHHSEGVCV